VKCTNSKEVQNTTGIGCKQRTFSTGFAAFALFLGLVQGACTEGYSMLPQEVDITGEWRGEMVGRILHQGNTQHNNIALSLEQVGDQVSGTFIFLDGPTLEAPVEGVVSGRKFTFTAETVVGDSCRVYVEAPLVVAETGQSMSGEKRLEHCDGTAVGTMSVARLGSEWIPPEIQPPLPPPAPPQQPLRSAPAGEPNPAHRLKLSTGWANSAGPSGGGIESYEIWNR